MDFHGDIMHQLDIPSLHQRAFALDREAFLLRAAGRRTEAASANVEAQALRERAARVQNGTQDAIDRTREQWVAVAEQHRSWVANYMGETPPMSRRGQALTYTRDTPLKLLAIGACLVVFWLGAIFGSAML
jgi:hypothetical protein